MPNASLSMLLYLFSAADMLLLAKVIGLRMLLSGASSLGQLIPPLISSRPTPSPTPGVCFQL